MVSSKKAAEHTTKSKGEKLKCVRNVKLVEKSIKKQSSRDFAFQQT